jgi:glycerate kinase
MRILAAPAPFKGTLSARQAAAAIADGVRRVLPDATVIERPVADGGEGTLDALGLPTRLVRVDDAWGRPRVAPVGEDGRTLVIELAALCGFDPARREVLTASSRGVGQALRAGLDTFVGRYLVCLGGSASCDAGAGMLRALGAELRDAAGVPLAEGGGSLERLARLQLPRLPIVDIDVACDVDAPLLGPTGAARRYAAQKGATPTQVEQLEAGLARFAAVVEDTTGIDLRTLPGGGAAGGVGAALALLGARLHPGAALVLDRVGFDALLAGADLVITGEGRVDAGTLQGKAPSVVAARAAARGVPVAVVAGAAELTLPGAMATWTLGPPAPSATASGEHDAERRAGVEAARIVARVEAGMRALTAGARG